MSDSIQKNQILLKFLVHGNLKRVIIIFVIIFLCLIIVPVAYIIGILFEKEPDNRLKHYTNDELSYQKTQIIPKSRNMKEVSELYIASIKNEDKKTVWLMSIPEFDYSGNNWNLKFEDFWQKYKGKDFTNIVLFDGSSDKYSCVGFTVQLDSKTYLFCLQSIPSNKVDYEKNIYKIDYYSVVLPPEIQN